MRRNGVRRIVTLFGGGLRAGGRDQPGVRDKIIRFLLKTLSGHVLVGWVGVNTSTQISRDDLADFILTQIDDRTFVHEMAFVSN